VSSWQRAVVTAAKKRHRHTGQLSFARSHCATHAAWNWCPHDATLLEDTPSISKVVDFLGQQPIFEIADVLTCFDAPATALDMVCYVNLQQLEINSVAGI
jgi:hypothetical protein